MKVNKKFFICAMLVLVLFLCINAGSATEPLNQTLGADIGDEIAIGDASNDALSASGETYVVDANGGGDYTSISSAVSDATGGETIFIKNGEYTESKKMTLTKSLNFVGESKDGVILKSTASDNSGYGFFDMSTSGVTLSFINLNFKDIPGGNVGTINVGGDSALDIINCTFDNCQSKYGTMWIKTTGTVNIEGTKILNSKGTATKGATAIFYNAAGTLNMKDTEIDGANYTASSGYSYATVYIANAAATATLDNVLISNCIGNTYAIIYSVGKTTVKNSKIKDNTVPGATGNTILRSNGNLIVEQSVITGNTGKDYLIYCNNGEATLNYNNIVDNTVGTSIYGEGGNTHTVNADYNWWGGSQPTGISVNNWVVEDNGEYKLNTDDALEKDIPELTGGDEPQTSEYDVYVSPDGDDANDGSSDENAVASLARAYELVPEGGSIYFAAGEYVCDYEDPDEGNLGLVFRKSASFIGENAENTIIDFQEQAYFLAVGDAEGNDVDFISFSNFSFKNDNTEAPFSLYAGLKEFNLSDCRFNITWTEMGGIYSEIDGLKMNIYRNYFELVVPLAIYGAAGSPEIEAHNNIFVGRYAKGTNPITFEEGATGSIDNNYYTTNDQPFKGGAQFSTWVISTVTVNPTGTVEPNDKVTITVDFNHYTDGTTNTSQSNLIPDLLTVNFSADGTLSEENVLINKGVATTTYTSDVERTDKVHIKIGNYEIASIDINVVEPYRGIIYVNATGSDDNEGSIDAPVATVGKAVELALANGGSGQIIINEGTYTGNNYHVTGDLNVTGKGKVTLDANNEGRLFNMAYGDTADKIVLSNLILTNANGYGAAVYSFAKELVLDNVTIANNQATGYLISSRGKLTIKDSNITNSLSGDVIQQSGSGDIFINNTVFENNSVIDSTSVYAVVNINSGSGTLTIEDSKFINNTARQGVIKGNANYNIVVKGTEFINNTNTVSHGGAIYSSGNTLNVADSVFVNNKAGRDGGAIYVGSSTTATVDKSVFVDNTANTMAGGYHGDAIYNGNKLTVNNSVLLTNAENFIIFNDGEDNVVNAQNNWWGTNDDPKSLNGVGTYEDYWDDEEYPCGEVDVSNWATMDASFTPADAFTGDEVTVTATFSNANLPDGIEVTFTSTSGLNTVVSTVAAQASTTYTIAAGDKAINATSTKAVVEMPIIDPFTTNIVTQDNFYTFFDESGILKESVPFDELIFKGSFSDLAAGYVILTKPVAIVGDEAVLNNMGIVVSSKDVSLSNLTFNATTALGDLVSVVESNVNLTNLNISYIISNDEAGRAISIIGASDVNVNNANITFESHVTDSGVDACAINIEDSENVVVDGSEINSSLPALYVNYEAATTQFMGLDQVNPVRIMGSNKVNITGNIINSKTNDYSQMYATIQAMVVVESNDCLIDSNNITLTDEYAQEGQDIYLYGISFAYDEGLVMSNNNFTIHTNGGKEAAGTAYAIQGIESDLSIVGNNITTFSNGPNLAIYITSMMGEGSTALIENNTLNVTGLAAAGNDWALVSGIEIQNGDVQIYNNTIYTYNVADEYDEEAYLSGISYVQWMYGGRTFDIQNNTIFTEGKYAIYLRSISNAIITGNELYAHDLEGNDAVYIGDGENNVVEDNIPEDLTNVVTNATFYKYFDENGMLLDTITFDELIFEGEFSDLVKYITLERAITITGNDSVLKDIAFIIAGNGITLDNMTLVANSDLGNLIDIAGENAVISNMNISYVVTEAATAINVYPAANGAQILNNTIYFESTVEDYASDEITAAIAVSSGVSLMDDEADPITGLVIDGNNITAVIPAFLADAMENEYYVMGLSAVNGVRINGAEDFEFTNNNLDVATNRLDRTTPTYQALYVASSSGLVDGNNITMIDTFTPEGKDVYLHAMELIHDEDLIISNNNFNMSTTGGKDNAGSAYAIVAIASDFAVTDNNITTVANGPNLGIYFPSRMGVACDAVITGNFINVTGLASDDKNGLVSGIEVQTGNVVIKENEIYTQNIGEYNESNNIYGISYAQDGVKSSFEITNNTIYTEGNYAISLKSADDATITNNTLYAHDLKGDKAVFIGEGEGNVVEDNLPEPEFAEIAIEANTVWVGSNGTVVVTIANATGNVTIKVNNKEFTADELDENHTATKEIPAEDLVGGVNNITVTYEGPEFKTTTATGVLYVADGVITNETYKYYFDKSGNLNDAVPDGATLDFQGLFLGKFPVYIDKNVNVISSTGDALFDAGDSFAGNAVNSFNIVAGGDNTNITGLKFINNCLYIKGASNVTVDDISIVANKRGVGSGTGFLSIHTGANNTLIKNSYFENGGTGSSLLVLGKGGAYAVFDHNVFNITGSSGNILSASQYVGTGAAPEHVSYTNNYLYNNQPGSPFCYAMTVSGSGNLVENNTIYHNGSGILNQYGASSTGNVYRNNTVYGNTNFNPSANSIVENNKIYATTNIAANTVATGNTFYNVAISGTNTTFADNNVSGTVTVSGNNNRIEDNNITSTGTYAVDLKSTTGNNVTGNYLIAKENYGQDAVNAANKDAVIIEDNKPYDPELIIKVDDIVVGQDAIINVTANEKVSGVATVIVNGKTYTVDVNNGFGNISVSDLTPSDYTVTATLESSVYDYGGSENSTVFNVAKLESDVNITISEAVLGNDTTITVSIPNATGNVTIIVNGKEETIPLDENGTATYAVENVTAGDYNVVAIYSGDKDHEFAYATDSFTVDKAASELNVTVTPGKAGEKSVIEFNVTEGATGTVIIDVNGTKYAVDVADGKLELALDAGNYSVVVAYSGDDKYDATVASEELLTVEDKLAANIEIEIPDDIKVGDDIIINITADTTANLTVTINGVPQVIVSGNGALGVSLRDLLRTIENGKVVYTVPSAGVYNVTVTAKENEEYLGETVTKVFEVTKKDAVLNITPITDAKVGDKVEIIVVNETDGALTIKVNGENVSGEYEITKVGTYTVTVESAPTDAYNAGFATYTFEVAGPANITIIIDGKEYTIPDVNGTAVDTGLQEELEKAKQNITNLTEQLANATAKVDNLTDELADAQANATKLAEDLADAQANATKLAEDLADAQANATKLAEDLADAQANATKLAEDLADAQANATKLAEDLADAQAKVDNLTGELANATAKVNDLTDELADANDMIGNLTGELANATAKVDNLTGELADAQANATKLTEDLADANDKIADLTRQLEEALANKTKTVVVDGVEYPIEYVNGTAVVNTNKTEPSKEVSNATITLPVDYDVNEVANVTVDIPGATGNVSVIVDGVETVVPLDENGAANVPITTTPGEHSIVVVYPGDDTHAPVVKSSTMNVEVFETQFVDIVVDGNFTITAKLVNALGDAVENATIVYTVGGVTNTTTTDANGLFAIQGAINELIVIGYEGDGAILGTNTSMTFKDIAPIESVPVESKFNIPGNSITINGYAVDTKAGEKGMPYATELLDADGKPIANVPIQFAVNNKIYNRTTYENGSFLPYNLNMVRAGRYTLALSFGGNENYTSTFAVACIDLDKKPLSFKASAKTFKASAKTKKYTMTVSTIVGSSADGKAHLRTGMKITMNVAGKTYTGKTNAKGQVSFNLKITKKGKYTAVLSYAGDNTYESATKNVKITIN